MSLTGENLNHNPQELRKKINTRWNQILRGFVAVLPIALLTDFFDVYTPLLVICLLRSLRLLKIWPVFSTFAWAKKKHLNLFRICEMLFIYY